MKNNYLSLLLAGLLSGSCTHQMNKTQINSVAAPTRSTAQEKQEKVEPQYFNLYESQWDVLKNIPIYDQSGFPACYSYAGSQFVEYFLRKNQMLTGANEHISPIWTAYNYKSNVSGVIGKKIKKKRPMTLGYGQEKKSIQSLTEEGVCKAEHISQNLAKITGNSKLSDSDAVAMIELVWENKDKSTESDIFQNIRSDWRMQRISKSSSHPSLSADRKMNSNEIKSAVAHVYNYLKTEPMAAADRTAYFSFFEREVTAGCEQPMNMTKYDIPDVRSVGKMYPSDKAINKKIWKGFEKMNFEYPVVIGYCSNVFKKQDSEHTVAKRNIAPRIVQRTIQPSSKCSAHYSLAMGKKYNDQTKNYDILVRNSYGNEYMAVSNGCFCRNEITQQFESCAPTTSSLFPPTHLTVLGCWLDQDKLADTVYDVISYKLDGQYKTEEVDPQFDIQ